MTWIPFFIGVFLGFLPDLLAIVFGIIGIVRANRVRRGMGLAVTGLVLGGLGVPQHLLRAGTVW